MRNLAFKNYLFAIILLTGILNMSCSQNRMPKDRIIMLHANMDTDDPVFYEMGKVYAGSSAEFMLNLKNTRQSPVVVNEVRSFCGCTIPDYTAEPVLPGEFSRIKVTFIADHLGIFDKAVRIYLKDKETPVELRLRGEVIRNKE